MTIDKNILKKFQSESSVAIAEIAKKYGLKLDSNNLSYNEFDVNMKIKLISEDAGAEIWLRHCAEFNLKPEWLNSCGLIQGTQYQIVGLIVHSRNGAKVQLKRLSDNKVGLMPSFSVD